MKIMELAVVVVGLFAGYWIVSKLFFNAPSAEPSPKAIPPTAPPAWCAVLNLPPSATALEIRDAYRRLISRYHPDKVSTLGQDLQDLAQRKSQEITAAYRDGMQMRGETF